jgi:hypothetical protein
MVSCGNVTTACGWEQLLAAQPIQAAFIVFDTAFVGWTIIILFFIFQFMLYMKLRNVTTNLIIGLFFASLYLTHKLGPTTNAGMATMAILLALEIGGVLYFLFAK